jgi:hypothetical protein
MAKENACVDEDAIIQCERTRKHYTTYLCGNTLACTSKDHELQTLSGSFFTYTNRHTCVMLLFCCAEYAGGIPTAKS